MFEQTVNAHKCAWRRTSDRARALYEKDCADAGQTPHPELCTTIRWHDLRREAVSWMLEDGLD